MESPIILEDGASMRQYSRDARHRGRTIGLVPTMVCFAMSGVLGDIVRPDCPKDLKCAGESA